MERRTVLIIVLVLLVIGGVLGVNLLLDRAERGAARAVAERYVDLIESGDSEDREELLSLTVTEQLGALRTAGDLLVGAEERIEVLSVGNERDVERSDVEVPYEFKGDHLIAFDVDYRLGDEDRTRTIVLGAMAGESGRDEDDWRVLTPLTGTIGWTGPAVRQTTTELYIGGERVVRAPGAIGVEEQVQPLYPAVYAAQRRVDPFYASTPETVVVTAGGPVSAPDLKMEPTARTTRMLTKQARKYVASCAFLDDFECPVADIAEDRGVDVRHSNDWFLGAGNTRIVFTDPGVVVTGWFRMVGPQGRQRVRYTATTRTFLDVNDWEPYLDRYDAQAATP